MSLSYYAALNAVSICFPLLLDFTHPCSLGTCKVSVISFLSGKLCYLLVAAGTSQGFVFLPPDHTRSLCQCTFVPDWDKHTSTSSCVQAWRSRKQWLIGSWETCGAITITTKMNFKKNIVTTHFKKYTLFSHILKEGYGTTAFNTGHRMPPSNTCTELTWLGSWRPPLEVHPWCDLFIDL